MRWPLGTSQSNLSLAMTRLIQLFTHQRMLRLLTGPPQRAVGNDSLWSCTRHFIIEYSQSSSTTMSQPKLTYFNGPGRAELTRLAFVAGGIAFDDHRVDHATFGELKPTLPLGQVPVLDVDGTTYPQSAALARYAGRLSGLYPADALEALKIDTVIETLVDIGSAASEIRWRIKDETVKADKTKALLEETLPKLFGFVEKSLAGKFLLGDKLSLADLAVFNVIENSLKPTFPDFDITKYSKLEALVAGVKANERVAAYLAK